MMSKLPPKAYTKIERFIEFNWQWLFIGAFILICFLFAFFYDEPLEDIPQYDERAR
jgi:hypothetical protein